MSFQSLESHDDTYLTAEQQELMMFLNPKFKDKYNQDIVEELQDEYQASKKRSDAFDFVQPKNDRNKDLRGVSQADNPISGTGVGAIIGTIAVPLIVKGVSSLINWIKRKRRGRGIEGGSALGIVNDFVLRNKDKLINFENRVKNMHPKEAWKNIIQLTRSMFKKILKQHGVEGKGVAGKLSDAFIMRHYPKHFVNMLNRKDGKIGSKVKLSNHSMSEPMIKYGIQKMVGDDELSKKVYKEVRNEVRKMIPDKNVSGAGVLSFLRKVLKKIGVPAIKRITGKLINSDAVKRAIAGILGRFGISEGISNELTDFGAEAVKYGVDKGVDKLAGKGVNPPQYRSGFGISPPNGGLKKKDVMKFRVKVL